MAFIEPVPDAEAAELGTLTNYTRALGHRPEIVRAWIQLNTAIKESMDLRRYELATVAASTRLGSSYCSLAHGSVLLDKFYDAATLRTIVADRREAGLSETDLAIMDLAEQIVTDATEVTHEDVDRLRAAGLDDAEIVSVVLAVAARCFFSKALDALGVEPDASYSALDPELRDALVVGRPIAQA